MRYSIFVLRVHVGMAAATADSTGQLSIVRIAQVLIETAVPTDVSENMPDWIGKLVVVQACVLEKMGSGGKEAALSKAAKIVQGGLRSRARLLGVYLDVLTAEDSSGDSLVALGAVAVYCRALPSYDGGSMECRSYRVCDINISLPFLVATM